MSHILIVEDEEVLADSLQDILVSEGYTVRVARNGMEAVEALGQGPTDLVLLDLMLPLLDGVSVLRGLRTTTPDTRVVVVSSCAPKALQGLAVDAFLRKPFNLDGLLEAVRAALQRPSPRVTSESA